MECQKDKINDKLQTTSSVLLIIYRVKLRRTTALEYHQLAIDFLLPFWLSTSVGISESSSFDCLLLWHNLEIAIRTTLITSKIIFIFYNGIQPVATFCWQTRVEDQNPFLKDFIAFLSIYPCEHWCNIEFGTTCIETLQWTKLPWRQSFLIWSAIDSDIALTTN